MAGIGVKRERSEDRRCGGEGGGGGETMVDLRAEYERWRRVKERLKLANDEMLATVLLDRFEASEGLYPLDPPPQPTAPESEPSVHKNKGETKGRIVEFESMDHYIGLQELVEEDMKGRIHRPGKNGERLREGSDGSTPSDPTFSEDGHAPWDPRPKVEIPSPEDIKSKLDGLTPGKHLLPVIAPLISGRKYSVAEGPDRERSCDTRVPCTTPGTCPRVSAINQDDKYFDGYSFIKDSGTEEEVFKEETETSDSEEVESDEEGGASDGGGGVNILIDEKLEEAVDTRSINEGEFNMKPSENNGSVSLKPLSKSGGYKTSLDRNTCDNLSPSNVSLHPGKEGRGGRRSYRRRKRGLLYDIDEVYTYMGQLTDEEDPDKNKLQKKQVVKDDEDYIPEDATDEEEENEAELPRRFSKRKTKAKEKTLKDTDSEKEELGMKLPKYPYPRKRKACSMCKETFSHKWGLAVHMHKAHGHEEPVRNFICEECGHEYGTLHALNVHKKRLHQESAQCEECKRTFLSRYHLANHVRHVHKFKISCCEICGEKVRSRMLKVHKQNKHMPKKVLKCTWPDCTKTLSSEYNLTVHMRIHNDEKPLGCDYCEYRCRQRNAMNWHMKKTHPGEAYNIRTITRIKLS